MRVFINYAAAQHMRPQLSVPGNISGGGITLYIKEGILPLQTVTDNGLFERSLSVACHHNENEYKIKYLKLC